MLLHRFSGLAPALLLACFSVIALPLQARADACTTDLAGVDFTLAPRDGSAVLRSGEPLDLRWQVGGLSPGCMAPGQRLWLVFDLPEQMRFEGEEFLALAPGDPGPFALDHASDRLRLVIDLTATGGEAPALAGQISSRAAFLGAFALGAALVHDQTEGEGDAARLTERSIRPLSPLQGRMSPGRPRLLVQEEFPTKAPLARALSADGLYLLELFAENRFLLSHVDSGTVLISETGFAPRFSPTGRFLHWFPSAYTPDPDSPPEAQRQIGEDFALADLAFGGEIILRGADLRPFSSELLLTGLDWSEGDSFLILHGARFCDMTLIQPLITGRLSHAAPGSHSCYGLESGRATVTPARDYVTRWSAFEPYISERHPLFRNGEGQSDYEADLSEVPYQLGSPVTSSYGPDPARPVPVLPGPVAPQAAEAAQTEEQKFRRGAVPLRVEAYAQREPGDLTLALRDRFADLGIALGPPAPPWHITETEALYDTGGPEDPEAFDGSFYIRSGSLSGLDLPGKAKETLDALSEPLMDETRVCIYGWPPVVQIHSRIHNDQVDQLVHVNCIVGTAALRESLALYLQADASGEGSSFVIGAQSLDAEEGELPENLAGTGLLSPWQLWPLADGGLAVTAPPSTFLMITPSVPPQISAAPDSGSDGGETLVLLSGTEQPLIAQMTGSGQVFLRDKTSGALLYQGIYLDDELILTMPDGTLRWTAEGGRMARVIFAGDPHSYFPDQLAPPDAAGLFTLPPALTSVTAERQGREIRLSLSARASEGLSSAEIYRDGLHIASAALSGPEDSASLTLPVLPETTALSIFARDRRGAWSTAFPLALTPEPGPASGRLFALAAGVDHYEDKSFSPLRWAGRDAERFLESLTASPSAAYSEIITRLYKNTPLLAKALPGELARIAAEAGPEDSLFLHLAGHGFASAEGRYYLATRETRVDQPAETALAWSDLAAILAGFPGRVVVFIDACHAGAAGAETTPLYAVNEGAAAALSAGGTIAVVAASKGRQFSHESAGLAGGYFTIALTRALGDPGTDLDGNGRISLTELYHSVKRETAERSGGAQTPWLMLNGLRGEAGLW